MNTIQAKFSPATNGIYPFSTCSTFPADAVDIPDDLYAEYKNGKSRGFVVQDDALIEKPVVAPTLSELKLAKKAEITANFEQTIQQITAGYPPNEIASWSKQEQEARAFTAVTLSPTPLIDALANTRGVPKVTLAARIIAKADLFSGISGQLIGKRQGLEDSIEAATSKTALAAIAW